MANHRNVDDARFIKIQHLPATTITWKGKKTDSAQYARAQQEMATPWKLDDARFFKNQQSRSRLRSSRSRSQLDARSQAFGILFKLVPRSLSLSLSLSLSRDLSLSHTLSLCLSISGSLSVSLSAPSLFSLSLSALSFLLSLFLSRTLHPVSLCSLSRTHLPCTAINAPNCECTENLTCMTKQSSKEQTPLHSASPKGSVDGKHCEEPAHSFFTDGKRQAIPAGVEPSLDHSPSCPHPMSPMVISPVFLSLSCSLSLSFACCLSLSLSLSFTHTLSSSRPLSLCVSRSVLLLSHSLSRLM